VPPRELIAELLGKATGCSHGRGGSMHSSSRRPGCSARAGSSVPSILMATGAGYSAMLQGSDRVSVAFFGDGAVSNGAFHEGLNLATVWDLPVLFVCENNLYATEVPFSSITRQPSVAARAASYGLPGSNWTGTTCWPSTGGGRGDRAGARRPRPDPAGMQDLPDSPAFRGDARRRIPHDGRDRRVEGARPDRAPPRPPVA
jgi:hypothetical protein